MRLRRTSKRYGAASRAAISASCGGGGAIGVMTRGCAATIPIRPGSPKGDRDASRQSDSRWRAPARGTRFADRVIRAPRGTTRTAKSWLTEAPLRMIQNNLDPEVAENPQELVVYGGIGRAARNWECFDAIVAALARARGRRVAADPVGQAGRRVQDAPRCAARADRQLQPRAASGRRGSTSTSSTARAS